MFEDQLKKLMVEKEKAKAFSGIDFKSLSKSVQEDMLKAGMKSMGIKYGSNSSLRFLKSLSNLFRSFTMTGKKNTTE